MNTTWVYIHSEHSSEHNLYTVGFYDPNGKFQPDSDHSTKEEAGKRVHYLNGGTLEEETNKVREMVTKVRAAAEEKYQRIVDGINKELKAEIKNIDLKDSVDLDIGHDRKIEIDINMSSVAEEVLYVINDILPPKDDFWEETM